MVSVSGTAVKLKNDDLVLDTSEKDIFSCEEGCKLNFIQSFKDRVAVIKNLLK